VGFSAFWDPPPGPAERPGCYGIPREEGVDPSRKGARWILLAAPSTCRNRTPSWMGVAIMAEDARDAFTSRRPRSCERGGLTPA
jgi:hypothetical protein